MLREAALQMIISQRYDARFFADADADDVDMYKIFSPARYFRHADADAYFRRAASHFDADASDDAAFMMRDADIAARLR